jgi:hypothetical protein
VDSFSVLVHSSSVQNMVVSFDSLHSRVRVVNTIISKDHLVSDLEPNKFIAAASVLSPLPDPAMEEGHI